MTLICLQNWVPALKAYKCVLATFQICLFHDAHSNTTLCTSPLKFLETIDFLFTWRCIERIAPLPKMIYPGTNSIYVPDICLLFMYEFCSIKFISWLFMHWLWILLGFLYFQYRYFSSNYGENHPCQQASHPGLSVYIYTSTLYSIPSILMSMLALRKRTIKDYKEKIYIPVHSRMRKKKSDRVLIINKSNVLLKDKKLNCNTKKDVFVTLNKFIIVFLLTIFR